jgi:hypothetical protein
MKIKKEFLFLILIIVVLSVYLTARRANHDDPELPKLAELDNNMLNHVVITRNDTSIELMKKDEQWLIAGQDYPADTVKVKNMLNAAAKLTATALVSEAGIYERYELDEDKRTTVKVFKDKDLQREFSIGRTAPTSQHTFLKLADDANVYHARGNLTNTFNHTIDDLRDKKVLSFDKAQISTLEIKKSKQIRILSKKQAPTEVKSDEQSDKEPAPQPPEMQWTDADGQTVDSSTVESLLGTLSNLTCDQYMADDAKAGLKEAAWTLTVKNEQESFSVSVFGKEEQTPPQYQATSSAIQFAFLLAESRVQNIEKNIDKLLEAESEK